MAAYIASIGMSNTVWLVLHPKSLSEVSDILTLCLREKGEREKREGKRQFRCLLVAPLWVSVPEILAQIGSFINPVDDDHKTPSIHIGKFQQGHFSSLSCFKAPFQ